MINDAQRISTLFILGKVKAVGIVNNIIPVHGSQSMKTIYVAYIDLNKRTYYRITKKAYFEAIKQYAVNTEEEARIAESIPY
jgi:hypothetical protein